MGKDKGGFLSPKAISNRIKSKGLQKLRWYCQMCQKQCRDANGFKCHTQSESHQRQLLLAGENPGAFFNFFSNEFRDDFLRLLRTRFGTKRVHNNVVYNEYISHKEHIHMNATRWSSLAGFTAWLGREGYCKVDQTEKGLFMQYIDRDPVVLKRQKELEKMRKRERNDEERRAKKIEEMVQKGLQKEKEKLENQQLKELNREDPEEKIVFKLSGNLEEKTAGSTTTSKVAAAQPASSALLKMKTGKRKAEKVEKTVKKKCALEEIIDSETKRKSRLSKRVENWIRCGIVVKVNTKRLGEKYFKKKAAVLAIEDKFTAVLQMLNTGDKIKADQINLETVLPNFGREVIILNGEYRGETAVMKSVDVDRFCAEVEISGGAYSGRRISDIKYEDISKKA